MQQLEQVRNKWLKAFLAGDVERLKQIELPSFVAASELGIESASTRYRNIENRKLSGTWFKSSASTEDIELSFHEIGPICQVVGIGKVVANGNTIRHCSFTEIWVNKDSQWKVQSIHIASIVSSS